MAARRGTKPWRARPTARRWCASSRRWRPWRISPTVVPPPSRPLTSGSAYAPRSMPWEKPLGGCSTTCAAPRPSPRRSATRCGSGGSTPTMAPIAGLVGEVDRAIDYGQRALALAATLGHVGLQARAHLILGRAYYDAGDYPRAVESLERNVATLQGDLLYERFGSNGIVAAISRAWLSHCHAERGAFTEGLAMAEEGLRIAETVHHPFSLIEACRGVSCVVSAPGGRAAGHPGAGAGHGAVPGLAHSALVPSRPPPWAWRMPWRGVSPRVWRWWSRGWSKRSPGADRGSGALGRLPQRGVSAGGPPGGGAPARRAGARPRPPVPATRHTRPGPCGSWARARRARRPQRSSPPPATTARPSPWPRSWACARSRRTATAAWARCMRRPASGSRPAPRCHGHRMYRAMEMTFWLPGGGGAGAGGSTMIMGSATDVRETFRPNE